jgi:hypothetical protein
MTEVLYICYICVIINIMTSHDPKPRSQEDLELESAKRLHDTLTAPFDRPFESLGYQADFSYTPSSNDAIFAHDGPWSTVAEATNLVPAQKHAWNVRLGYDPKKERIVTTTLEVPVFTPRQGESLVFQRIMETGEYLLLHREETDAELKLFATQSDEFEMSVFQRNSANSLSEGYVDKLLIAAGYTSPEIFTTPDDLQEHVAETLDTATAWSRKETIITPIEERKSVTLERTSSVQPAGRFEESTGGYTHETDGHVKATISYFNEGYIGQLIITFAYSDHFVSMPKVTIRKKVPAFDDAVIAQHGPDAVQYVDSGAVELSIDDMDALAEELALAL